MSFVKTLASGGLFGLAGMAAANSGKKKPTPSLVASSPTAIDTTGVSTPSLISKGGY